MKDHKLPYVRYGPHIIYFSNRKMLLTNIELHSSLSIIYGTTIVLHVLVLAFLSKFLGYRGGIQLLRWISKDVDSSQSSTNNERFAAWHIYETEFQWISSFATAIFLVGAVRGIGSLFFMGKRDRAIA